jgi:hypothetical protein
MDFANVNGIVFYEQGAILGSMLTIPRHPQAERFYRVPRIEASPGVGPFLYQAVPRPDPGETPAVPPWIRSVVPPAGAAGEIITLKGKGFARTTEVRFVRGAGDPHPAGFRIVSDQQLKVEVPDRDLNTGPHLLAVISTEGITITIPRDRTIRPGPMRVFPIHGGAAGPRDAILWVGPGDQAPAPGPGLVIIARGGRVDQFGPGATYFIQRGGRLGDDEPRLGIRGPRGGRAQAVYYEPGAIVPERLKQAPGSHEVPAIVPSLFNEPFTILPGPLFRR